MTAQTEAAGTHGLLLSDDLFFSSRITGTARALGFTLVPVRSAEVLEAQVRRAAPCCVIVDLSNPGLKITLLIQRLRDLCPEMPRVVAYGSHVDTATLKAAREAGCDLVLPRSKFVEDLPRALPEWVSTRESEEKTSNPFRS